MQNHFNHFTFKGKTFCVLPPAVLRCLGIASRPITNFNSAHDNTGNLRVDLLYLADGRPDTHGTLDSMWLVQDLADPQSLHRTGWHTTSS